MPLKEIICDAKCNELHTVVSDSGSTKYIVFTRCESDLFVICVSDGCDLWKLELDQDEFDTARELADLNSEAYLNNLRSGFSAKDVQVSQMGVKATVTVGSGRKQLSFDLFEAKAADKKTELQTLMFRLADKVTNLESTVEKAQTTIENLQQQRGGGSGAATGIGGVFDIAEGGKKNAQKAAPKKTGMSVINPASRKRKAAKGVEFD